jgi:hypothetical protein
MLTKVKVRQEELTGYADGLKEDFRMIALQAEKLTKTNETTAAKIENKIENYFFLSLKTSINYFK